MNRHSPSELKRQLSPSNHKPSSSAHFKRPRLKPDSHLSAIDEPHNRCFANLIESDDTSARAIDKSGLHVHVLEKHNLSAHFEPQLVLGRTQQVEKLANVTASRFPFVYTLVGVFGWRLERLEFLTVDEVHVDFVRAETCWKDRCVREEARFALLQQVDCFLAASMVLFSIWVWGFFFWFILSQYVSYLPKRISSSISMNRTSCWRFIWVNCTTVSIHDDHDLA